MLGILIVVATATVGLTTFAITGSIAAFVIGMGCAIAFAAFVMVAR